MKKIVLAYCSDNADLVENLDNALRSTKLHFEHLTEIPNAPDGAFAQALEAQTDPVLLLTTDNLLKNSACMAGLLPVLQRLLPMSAHIVPAVAEGRWYNDTSKTFENTPTAIDRLADALRYMNYWQTYYLQTIDQQQHRPAAERGEMESKVQTIHDIASEVGQVIDLIRHSNPVAWYQLTQRDYATFFERFQLWDAQEVYKNRHNKPAVIPVAAPEPEVAEIEIPHIETPEVEHSMPEKNLPETAIADMEIPPAIQETKAQTLPYTNGWVMFTPVEPEANGHKPEIQPPAPTLQPELLPETPQTNVANEDIAALFEEEEKAVVATVETPDVAPEPDEAEVAEIQNMVTEPDPDEAKVAEIQHITHEPAEVAIPEIEAAAHEPEPTEVATAEVENPAPETAQPSEIEQTIQDAQVWLSKGHTELGKQVMQLALEQHPDNEVLRNAYIATAQQYGFEAELPDPTPLVHSGDSNGQPQPEARSYDRMGDTANEKADHLFAKYCWDRVAEIDPEYPGIYQKLGLLCALHLPQYHSTAIVYLEKALAATLDNADVSYALAQLYIDQQQDLSLVIDRLRQTVELRPDHAEAWLSLAFAWQNKGNATEANTAYRQAIALNPALRNDRRDVELLLVTTTAPPPSNTQTPKHSDTQTPEHPNTQAPKHPSTQTPKHPNTQTPKPSNTQAPKHPNTQTPNPLTVLITGATSDIGRAVAELFARDGHRVIIAGRSDERLDAVQGHLLQTYDNPCQALNFDVRHYPSVETVLRQLPEDWQNIDVLINNANVAKGFAPIHEGNPDDWDIMIDTNIKGLLYTARAVTPGMVARRKGHIINIGAATGSEIYPNGNVYSATKFAIDGLTKAMRMDLHPYNIRVSGFNDNTDRAAIDGEAQTSNTADIAAVIYFMATRPAHINLQDVLLNGELGD
jgi:NADP-dependent 3-hydroxy acid dehydrogenase YdfG